MMRVNWLHGARGKDNILCRIIGSINSERDLARRKLVLIVNIRKLVVVDDKK